MNRLSVTAALIAALSDFSCAKRAQFKSFVSKDGRFEVSTPAELGHQSRPLDFDAGQVTMHSYAAERDSVVYAVNYFDIPEPVNGELRKHRPGYEIPARSQMLRSNHWTADSVKGDELAGTATEVASGEKSTATPAKQSFGAAAVFRTTSVAIGPGRRRGWLDGCAHVPRWREAARPPPFDRRNTDVVPDRSGAGAA